MVLWAARAIYLATRRQAVSDAILQSFSTHRAFVLAANWLGRSYFRLNPYCLWWLMLPFYLCLFVVYCFMCLFKHRRDEKSIVF